MDKSVELFRAISLKHGLKLYAKTGMKPNRQWTPSAMMRTAKAITGKTFKPRDYNSAVEALDEWIKEHSTEETTHGQS